MPGCEISRFDDLLLLFYTALNRLVAGARVFHLNAKKYRYSERRCFLFSPQNSIRSRFIEETTMTLMFQISVFRTFTRSQVLQAVLIASAFKQRRRLHCTVSKEFRSRAFWNCTQSTCRYARNKPQVEIWRMTTTQRSESTRIRSRELSLLREIRF